MSDEVQATPPDNPLRMFAQAILSGDIAADDEMTETFRQAEEVELRAFGAEHYPDMAGKTIPAQVVLAWLSVNHDHLDDDEERGPIVDSRALERFIRENAQAQ